MAKDALKRLTTLDIRQKFGVMLIYLALIKFGEGDISYGLLNLEWASKNDTGAIYFISTFYLHGYRLPKNRELGIEYLKSAAATELTAKIEYAALYLRGVYVEQNVDLALECFIQIIDVYPEAANYVRDIKTGFYYFPIEYNALFIVLGLELQFSDDYAPVYKKNSYCFGLLEQEDSF